MGASDPLSGHVALMAEAKAFGQMAKAGWKPKRTIVYLSWDAEETGLIGSTEWAETHGEELKAKAVIYINSDGNGRGFLGAGGSHDYQHLVNQVAADVRDPQTKVSVGERLRAKLGVDAAAPGASETAKATGKLIAAPGSDFPIGALGSGSDYSSFFQHLGIATLDIGYGGEGESGGVYHSLYDDYEHHSRFVDPGFAYDATLAKTVGRLVYRISDADLPVQRFGDFADTVARYLDEVKKLADSRKEETATQARLLAANAYNLAADPTQSHAPPAAFTPSTDLNFAALETAVGKLKTSAAAFDSALATKGAGLSAAQKVKLDATLRPLTQSLMYQEGLPGRPWFKNVIYAPGLFTGYGAKTLPGVREAIEERRFADAQKYVGVTGQALSAYAARLDQATAVLNGG
jgi:N-acetylated-alpha-linked acidic dipeptidase